MAEGRRTLVENNRKLFLWALRSGEYPKGPIETDAMGGPLDPKAAGWCVVGLAYTLFCDGVKTGTHSIMMAALGLTGRQLTHIQQVWNDSPLTFPEIADLIGQEMFGATPGAQEPGKG